MNNRSWGFRLLLLSASLIVGLSMANCHQGPTNVHGGGPPNCTTGTPVNRSVTLTASGVTPADEPIDVCPGDSITWSTNDANVSSFQISFVSPPLTDQPVSPNVHPARATTFPSGTTAPYTATGNDASIVWPNSDASNCTVNPPLQNYQYCYKYSLSVNGQPVSDPHVIIMPPTN